MLHFYSLFVLFVAFFLQIIAWSVPKLKLFVKGRKDVFEVLNQKINPNQTSIWFHVASLGEYEQGLPVIQKIKQLFPKHQIVLTFFSPSGFEVRKNNSIADITIYLPMDTIQNAKKFIATINPKMVFFIKYEFWPNYLNELKKQNISTYLISGIFRKNQIFFKTYGGFYRNCLQTFEHFFVQNEESKNLLQSINFKNTTISGDTRFDRVFEILNQNNSLDFVNQFVQNQLTIVAGSTWQKDEDLIVNFINSYQNPVKFIIAPHNIKANDINQLQKSILKKTILFSEIKEQNLATFDVLIIDTIGLLTKIYSKATIAYIGGGFGNPGVHNVLEPAVFGIPIVIGKNYSHFAEATALVDLKGIISIENQEDFNFNLDLLITNESICREKGTICKNYVLKHKGATKTILDWIKSQK